MKKILFITLMAFVCQTLFVVNVQAQQKEKKNLEIKAAKFESTRGADENIKAPKPTTDVKVEAPAPSRGSDCTVYINNHTGYSIDVYIDGYYKGTIGAYDEKYSTAVPGTTKLYGKSIGGTMYWGPTYIDCQYEYTWNLYE